jgi:HAD superfamily hydrolase (TIGR01509 family)
MPLTHVIFDCDGVLVDSETLSAGVLKTVMAEVGFDITDDVFRADFLGRSFANASARAEMRFGRKLPSDMQLRYRDRLLAEMKRSLKPMPQVHSVLDALKAPYCLATSSSPQRLAVSLDVTRLAQKFESRCFTASQVKHGKPAPDLFLLAAKTVNADPKNCLVIEDSLMGIEAAIAANMQVWRFMGGSHMTREDHAETPPSVRPIANMADLLTALTVLGLCRTDHARYVVGENHGTQGRG